MTPPVERSRRKLRDLMWAPGCFAISLYSWALTRTTRSRGNQIAQLAGWAGAIIFFVGGVLFIYVEWLRWRRRRNGDTNRPPVGS